MGITTLVAFLFGGRKATVAIAQTRSALWIGAAFTLSAAGTRKRSRRRLLKGPRLVEDEKRQSRESRSR
jgi:hypothetical protein